MEIEAAMKLVSIPVRYSRMQGNTQELINKVKVSIPVRYGRMQGRMAYTLATLLFQFLSGTVGCRA